MDLAQRYLPNYQFIEKHSLPIDAAPADVLDAVERLTHADDPLVRFFMRLRESPARLLARMGRSNALVDRPMFGLHEFTRLERLDDRSLAYGLVGRFWRSDFALERIADAAQFSAFARPGIAKLVLSFRCTTDELGKTLLSTETRVFCPDARSRWLFTPYWLLIRPVSGLIRRRMLSQIRQHMRVRPV